MTSLVRSTLRWSLSAVVLSSLIGCRQAPPTAIEAPRPFVFRSLDLNQRRDDGSRDWDLQSPEARYELSSRTVRARRPSGVLYRNDKPAYRISAELATVLNDGELVVLEGEVRLQQLNEGRLMIRGDRLVWTPARSLMVIDQNPEALDRDSRLLVRHLTFHQDRETLDFLGPTQLQRWHQTRQAKKPPQTVVRTGDGSWNLQSGSLEAAGPVTAVQAEEGRTLKASRLIGNTDRKYIDLIAPVRLTLPAQEGVVKAGDTRWRYADQQFTSDVPFRASLKRGEATGLGFRVNQATSTVIVPSNGRLKQPGEQLKARRCSWNWVDETIIADGNVELRRSELDQVTKAERLEGRTGKNGGFQFGVPGERVTSTLRLGETTPAKRTNPPVSF